MLVVFVHVASLVTLTHSLWPSPAQCISSMLCNHNVFHYLHTVTDSPFKLLLSVCTHCHVEPVVHSKHSYGWAALFLQCIYQWCPAVTTSSQRKTRIYCPHAFLSLERKTFWDLGLTRANVSLLCSLIVQEDNPAPAEAADKEASVSGLSEAEKLSGSWWSAKVRALPS